MRQMEALRGEALFCEGGEAPHRGVTLNVAEAAIDSFLSYSRSLSSILSIIPVSARRIECLARALRSVKATLWYSPRSRSRP